MNKHILRSKSSDKKKGTLTGAFPLFIFSDYELISCLLYFGFDFSLFPLRGLLRFGLAEISEVDSQRQECRSRIRLLSNYLIEVAAGRSEIESLLVEQVVYPESHDEKFIHKTFLDGEIEHLERVY